MSDASGQSNFDQIATTEISRPNVGPYLYPRYIKFVIADDSGNGLDFSDLRIVFQVTQNQISTPNSLTARIYNVSRGPSDRGFLDTVSLIQNEFTNVEVTAGYVSNNGVIFKGKLIERVVGKVPGTTNVWQRQGQDNPVDSFIDIFASDGDQAHTYGVVNRTLSAGYSLDDHYQAITSGWSPYGIQPGPLPDGLPTRSSPRGRTVFGMVRDHLRTFTLSNGLTYTIRNDTDVAVQYVPALAPADAFNQDEAIYVNAQSGMLAVPEQTVSGINVRVLLNPKITFSRRIILNNRDIIQAPPNFESGSPQIQSSPLDPQGTYVVTWVTHQGDTRGGPGSFWFSDLICEPVNVTGPVKTKQTTAVGPVAPQ